RKTRKTRKASTKHLYLSVSICGQFPFLSFVPFVVTLSSSTSVLFSSFVAAAGGFEAGERRHAPGHGGGRGHKGQKQKSPGFLLPGTGPIPEKGPTPADRVRGDAPVRATDEPRSSSARRPARAFRQSARRSKPRSRRAES